jgi:hypothetical protein
LIFCPKYNKTHFRASVVAKCSSRVVNWIYGKKGGRGRKRIRMKRNGRDSEQGKRTIKMEEVGGIRGKGMDGPTD